MTDRITVSLDDAIGQDLRIQAARTRTSVSEFAAGLIAGAMAGAMAEATAAKAPVPVSRGSAGEAAESDRRPLASDRAGTGKCQMDVPKGTKCKVCGKVH